MKRNPTDSGKGISTDQAAFARTIEAASARMTMGDFVTTPSQAAVIPVRRGAKVRQVCLIRRIGRISWGIPKGFIEPGDDWEQAALTEAYEEAGLRGRMLGEAIGTYDYEKGLMTRTVVVGVMEVLEELAVWDEMRWRQRRWYSIDKAGALLAEHPVWPLYDRLRPTLVATPLSPMPQRRGGDHADHT